MNLPYLNFCYYTLVIAVALIKDCNGCFASDEYQNSSIKTGSSFYVECECTENKGRVENLKWLDKDNKIITKGPGTDSNIYVEWLPESVNLHIPNVSKDMSGTYKCVSQLGGREYVHTHNLHVYDPLSFVNTSDVQYILEGTDAKINCQVKSDSTLLIIGWHRDENLEAITNSDKYEVVHGGLIVYNVEKRDEGTYRCNVLSEATSEEIDKYIKVKVMIPPIITKVEAIPEKTVIEGEKVIIECVAKGSPEPEYLWSKKSGLEPDENKNITWYQDGNKIIFQEIDQYDTGCYECLAFNSAGNTSQEITIEVLVPPKITKFDNITAVEEAAIQIVCEARGIPIPNITITYEPSNDQNQRESPQEITNLAVLQVEKFLEGIYTCNASNIINYDTKSMYLTVLHKPYFEKSYEEIWGWIDKTIILSCEHESNPKSTKKWRPAGPPKDELYFVEKKIFEKLNQNNGNDYLTVTIDKNFTYGGYVCDVKNQYGEAYKTIVVREGFPPSPILNMSIAEITATSATFNIEVPINFTGPNVTGFKAEYDSIANYEITSVHNERTWATNRPYRVTNLKPNTTYSIKFAAINEVGSGEWSEAIEFDTVEKSAPEAPIWEEDYVQTSPSGNLVLQWRAPENNGEPIDYYSIRYCPTAEDDEEESENLMLCVEERLEPTTKLDLSSLEPNMTYHLELIAHNNEGNSTAATITVKIPAQEFQQPILPAAAIIGIAVAVVLLCLLLLDLLFLFWRQQGIIASCCFKKEKKNEESVISRDKKGLLKDSGESRDTLSKPNNGHKEYEYNKTTGVITGKHSSV